MFITKKVFDPELKGKAVKLSGSLIEGNFVVVKVLDFDIDVIGEGCSIERFPMEDFEHGAVELNVLTLPQLQQTAIPKSHTKGFTRNQGVRNNRTIEQVKIENTDLETILQEHIEPLKLEGILDRMRKQGHTHWNHQNATGFVKHAIKCSYRIKKFAYGVYGYDWGYKK